jgi:hypothetical protein
MLIITFERNTGPIALIQRRSVHVGVSGVRYPASAGYASHADTSSFEYTAPTCFCLFLLSLHTFFHDGPWIHPFAMTSEKGIQMMN